MDAMVRTRLFSLGVLVLVSGSVIKGSSASDDGDLKYFLDSIEEAFDFDTTASEKRSLMKSAANVVGIVLGIIAFLLVLTVIFCCCCCPMCCLYKWRHRRRGQVLNPNIFEAQTVPQGPQFNTQQPQQYPQGMVPQPYQPPTPAGPSAGFYPPPGYPGPHQQPPPYPGPPLPGYGAMASDPSLLSNEYQKQPAFNPT